MNKEAHAIVYYIVKCQDDNLDPIPGIVVEITIGNGAPTEHQTDENGLITIAKDFSVGWTAEIVDFNGFGPFESSSPYNGNPAILTQPLTQIWTWEAN